MTKSNIVTIVYITHTTTSHNNTCIKITGPLHYTAYCMHCPTAKKHYTTHTAPHPCMYHTTPLYSTALHYCTAKHHCMHCCTAQHHTTPLHCTARHHTTVCTTSLHARHCPTALHSTTLHSTTPHSKTSLHALLHNNSPHHCMHHTTPHDCTAPQHYTAQHYTA